jgi:hypothetical protein
MKVTTKFGLNRMQGKVDGLVYYTLPNSDVVVGRKLPEKFKQATQHNDYRLIAKNLRKIKPSQAFKDDFKVYTSLYKDLPQADKKISGWYNLYIKMLWDMQKAGMADLKTLTREQIIAQNLPCKSVKAAVEAGMLVPVLNFQALSHEI